MVTAEKHIVFFTAEHESDDPKDVDNDEVTEEEYPGYYRELKPNLWNRTRKEVPRIKE